MAVENNIASLSPHFCLEKWYLDFVGNEGQAMIFYSARLTIGKWSASYTFWLNHQKNSGVVSKSRFTQVRTPKKEGTIILWSDPKFGISGIWKAEADAISARLFESANGYLDWECYQPASAVQLKFNELTMTGTGYAEKLTLTAPPWVIPMNQLRWGRFIAPENNLVWIEIKEKENRQWLWHNGIKIEEGLISDHLVVLAVSETALHLDQGVILESEKKIASVGQKIVRYIPGFNQAVPLNFLLANECKWLSKGVMQKGNGAISTGYAIHEFVDFKSQ